MCLRAIALWSIGAVLLAQEAKTPQLPAQPREVRKIFGDGKHNAFTALARFRDQYWLAFRTGKDHNSADGDILVLRSADGKEWAEAYRLNAAPDDRDPQFLLVGKRLLLYDPAMTGKDCTTYAVYTEDGKTWSKPQPVYEPRYILWKPCAHGGKYYATAHKKDEEGDGKGRAVHLIVSEDGLRWQKVSTIRAGNWESETTLHFEKNGHLLAFLRQKYGSPACEVLEADAPYTEWKRRPAGVPHLSGHSIHTFKGTTYLFSRTVDAATKKTGTMIYTLSDGKLQPYCVVPSGGDCSYAEAVEHGDDMLVTFYSSHEGATNIYQAFVPLKK
jgi:hypothetical protein